jgi:uncharacterized protein (DUF433 family)
MPDVTRIYGGHDPRDLPNYSITEVASYLSIPRSTVHAWVLGMGRGQGRTFKPVIEIADVKAPALSFFNVVEVHVLDALRQLGPQFQSIRKAVRYVEKELGKKRPLATQDFYTDGVSVFVEHLGMLLNAPKDGQFAIRKAVEQYLSRVDYGQDRMATKLYPFTRRGQLDDPKSVVFDPLVSFGRLVVAETGVPTVEIADRFNAGETLDELARDFRVGRDKVEEAIRCELHLKKAA